ncbi:MAG: hypothetical protein IJV48_02880 [Ruminococcus sp.]|nr:hypothetical protein [Ruminococcus sp.]
MDNERITVWIVPMSLIYLIMGVVFFMSVGLGKSLADYIYINRSTIITVCVVVSVAISLVYLILSRSFLSGLGLAFAFSQAVFFILYGGLNLSNSGNGLKVVSNMLVTLLYAGYGLLTSGVVVILGLSLVILSAISLKLGEPISEDAGLGCSAGLPAIIGVIGWIMNFIIFVIF